MTGLDGGGPLFEHQMELGGQGPDLQKTYTEGFGGEDEEVEICEGSYDKPLVIQDVALPSEQQATLEKDFEVLFLPVSLGLYYNLLSPPLNES